MRTRAVTNDAICGGWDGRDGVVWSALSMYPSIAALAAPHWVRPWVAAEWEIAI